MVAPPERRHGGAATTLERVAEPKPTRRARSRRGPFARAWSTATRLRFAVLLLVAAGFGIAIGVYEGGDAGDATPSSTTEALFRSEQEAARGQPARQVVEDACGTCHTLRGAGVRGIIGPDLDRTVLTTTTVRTMIATGSLDRVMPKNLLVGEDADRIARYVARESRASRRARAKTRG
jgi:hypothetical protein